MRNYLSLLFLLFVSFFILYYTAIWNGLNSFVFAWVLNLMLMMISLSFIKILKPKLTSNYYSTQDWEKQGNIYPLLGINTFRKILVFTGWEKINKKENPVKNNIESLLHLEYGTRQSEFLHLIVFFIVLPINIFVAIKLGISQSLWLLILNVFLNFYPIILQRFNRPRLKKIIDAKTNL